MANVFYQKGKKYNCIKNGTPYFRKTAVIGGKQRSFYGDGEKDALKKIEEAKRQEQNGVDFDKRSTKVGEAFRHWLYDIKRVDKNVKPSSFAIYDGEYRKYVKDRPIAGITLSKLSSSSLQRYLTDLYEKGEATGKGIDMFMRLFKQFCNWAVDEGYLQKTPCKSIIIPGKRELPIKDVETFTEEERAKLLKYMKESGYEYDAIIELAFATGMRKGELLALRWDDIEDDIIHVRRSTNIFDHVDGDGNRERKREMSSTKTSAGRRDIPITANTQQMLFNLHHAQKLFCLRLGIPQSDYVFINRNGNLISASNLDKSYSGLLKRAGIPHKKFHAIRHTFATEAIRKGVPVKDVQMLMGHADIATTYIYVHSSEESKRKAIELIGEMM